jgi:hypothetical protein
VRACGRCALPSRLVLPDRLLRGHRRAVARVIVWSRLQQAFDVLCRHAVCSIVHFGDPERCGAGLRMYILVICEVRSLASRSRHGT